MAFVHAISSAGVAHALTRACSSGELENCGCDRSLRGMSPEGFQVKLFSTKIIQNQNMLSNHIIKIKRITITRIVSYKNE